MTTIEMDVDFARMNSENLSTVIRNLTETRKILIAKCEAMTASWQSGSSDEFQEVHNTQMSILWSKIQTLIQLSIQLDAAIAVAEQVDQNLAGG
jgi:uncharacterized protein YukE